MKDFPEVSKEEMAEIRREALEFAGIGLYRYSFDGIVHFMDRGALRILDLEDRFADPAEVRGKNISDLIVYKGPRGYLRSQIREHGHVRDMEYPFETLTGRVRWALHDSYLVRDEKTNIELIQVIVRDVTKRKRAELALADQKERLAVTLRCIGDGVITTDIDGNVVLLNTRAEELTAWSQEDAFGKPLSEVFRIINQKTRVLCENPVSKVLQTGQTVGLANDTMLVARDGSERIIADSGAPIRDQESRIVGVVLVFRDVTKQYHLEEEMQRIERLSSLGVLAGGIAHDFNNFLMGILGSFSMIQLVADNPEVERLAHVGESAAERARDLTSQLLTFAKGGVPIRRTMSLINLAEETVAFTLRGSKVGFELTPAADLWLANIDESQICQVVSNLVLNAEQAMPNGGTIEVSCSNFSAEPDVDLPLQPGRYLKLSIEDEGIGIPDDLLPQIFDPFFTTKQKGSGLGLSTCFSIIQKHGGHVRVESALGEGTRFEVFLPAAVEDEAPDDEDETPSIQLRTGRILVMDDDPVVRDVLDSMLSVLDFKVEFAPDGAAAIERYRSALDSDEAFDMVILDLTVPGGMGGKEAAEKLLEIDADVRAIASSGYSTDAVMSDFRSFGFVGAIAKPYNVDALEQLLYSLMDEET